MARLNDLALEKIKAALGKDTVKDLDALNPQELDTRIAQATGAMADAKAERDALPAYQEAKQACSDLSEGLKAVNKRQKAVIAYALHLKAS